MAQPMCGTGRVGLRKIQSQAAQAITWVVRTQPNTDDPERPPKRDCAPQTMSIAHPIQGVKRLRDRPESIAEDEANIGFGG
jgi:hypothetical protein